MPYFFQVIGFTYPKGLLVLPSKSKMFVLCEYTKVKSHENLLFLEQIKGGEQHNDPVNWDLKILGN